MNRNLFFIKKNKMIIINLVLLLVLSLSIYNLIYSKEQLGDIKLQIEKFTNNNSRNSIKARELKDLIKLSNDNGYEKAIDLDLNNYFLNELNNLDIVVTTENILGEDLNYRFLEGYGDKYSVNGLLNILTKKYNLAFEILELKIWPEENFFKFYLKFNVDMNNWIRKEQKVSLLNFNTDNTTEYKSGLSEDNYYYQYQSDSTKGSDSERLIFNELPGHIKFKGFIRSQDIEFFLFEINNRSVFFKLNEEQKIDNIKYKVSFNNGLFLNENFKTYKIGE